MSRGERTAQSRADQRDSELRYLDLLQHLPAGVYRSTAGGQIIEANQALADILGYRRVKDLQRLNVNDFYVRKESRREHIERLAATLTAFSEFELRTRDGRTIWVRDYPPIPQGRQRDAPRGQRGAGHLQGPAGHPEHQPRHHPPAPPGGDHSPHGIPGLAHRAAETLLKHADQAMYEAKAAGRDVHRRFGEKKKS
jgi:PAS domain S-box-containing protein